MLYTNKSIISLNKDDIINLYHKILNMVGFIINIIILFLSITKMIKICLLSFVITIILQFTYNERENINKMFLYLLINKYEWIDLVFTITTLTILFTIIVIFKMVSDKINKKFDELNNIIKQKNMKIENLNIILASKNN
jgi:hypothetical protein